MELDANHYIQSSIFFSIVCDPQSSEQNIKNEITNKNKTDKQEGLICYS